MSIELNNVASGYNILTVNNNFEAIQNELNLNVLRRNGLNPGEANQMNVPLDMNGFGILNAEIDGIPLSSLGKLLKNVGTYGGVWSGSAVSGSYYEHNGNLWLCILDTTEEPGLNKPEWYQLSYTQDASAESSAIESQEQLLGVGATIYPQELEVYADVNDTIPTLVNGLPVTHLRVLNSSSSRTEIVKLSEPAVGVITEITEDYVIAGSQLQYFLKEVTAKDIAELKLSTIYAEDGRKVKLDHYAPEFGIGLSLYRNETYDTLANAGTDWNDNGLVSNRLLCYDALGQAWEYKCGNVFAPRLGISNREGFETALEYLARQKTTITAFNSNLIASNGSMDLGGREIKLLAPINFPQDLHGIIIRNGMLTADASFTGASLLNATTDIDWVTSVCLEALTLSGNHVTGCLDLNRGHNWKINRCRFHGYATFGIQNSAPGTSNHIDNCDFYEYHYGEPGFDDPNSLTGTAIIHSTSDLILTNFFIGYGQNGIKSSGGNLQVAHGHLYGLLGLGIEDSASSNTYEDVIMDDPCQILLSGVAPGYGTSLTDIKFTWGSPRGAMIKLSPNSPVNLSGLSVTGSRFFSSPYSVPATLELTLGATGIGETSCTASELFFDEDMVGATVISDIAGVFRITAVNSEVSATVYVVERFSSVNIPAESWSQKVTPIYANPAEFSTSYSQVTIKDNFYANDAIQPMFTDPVKKMFINGLENFELEFGRWLVLPYLYDAVPNQREGTPTSNLNCKLLYTAGPIAAFDFSGTFTGDFTAYAYSDRGYV